MCLVRGMPVPIPIPISLKPESRPRTPETAVTTAANDDLSTVSKPDDDNLPASRPHNGDTYVRKRPASVRHTSARNSKTIAIQHGSHQSVRVDLAPGQTLTRVTSKRHASSPIATPDATKRASYILAGDRDDGHRLHQSISPPLIVHAPTPPQQRSPRASHTLVTYQDRPSPRATQQSFHSYHSVHTQHSHHSRNGSHHSRSGSHHSRSGSRSGSHSGRHSRVEIVPPPASDTSDTPMMRSRSDAGYGGYSPASPSSPRYGHAPRASMPSITHERSVSRERSRERTSTGQSFLNPDARTIEEGLSKNRSEISRDGPRLISGGDNLETVKIYGVNPRSSTGRVAARGGERFVVVDADSRRRYGSQ